MKKRAKNYPVIEFTEFDIKFHYQKQGLKLYFKRFFLFWKYRKIKKIIKSFNLTLEFIDFDVKNYNRLIQFLHENKFIKMSSGVKKNENGI